MVESILGGLKGFLDAVVDTALNVLPISPFTEHIDALAELPYLGYLNWFVPVGALVAIGTSWLVAIGIYYAIMIILRWVKAIS
ncbi:MAG: hypothetical protein FWG91_05730 [Lachnospiraceae bacterium]|nr:hypothetical protein [Lachnospiraceae bacterium]